MLNHSKLFAKAMTATAAALISGGAFAVDAEGSLYGDLRWSLDYAEDNSGVPGPTVASTDNNSSWGVKATTSKGGVTVFGAFERFLDADDPPTGSPVEVTRQAYIGLHSFCGTVKVGRHATAYSEAGRKLDPFYNTTVSGFGGIGTAGSIFGAGNSHGSSTLFNGDGLGAAFVANHIAYQSPAFWNFRGNAAFFVDETNTADQDHDYGGGVEYAAHGVTAGAQFLDANGANGATWGADVEATRLHAGYAKSRFGVGATWEKLDLPGANANFLMVSGWYGVREDTRIAVSYGLEDDSGSEGDSVRAGVFHDLIENLTVWAAARRYNESAGANPDADVVTLGASYKFNLSFSATR